MAEAPLRRVLVALDPAEQSREALEIAARLAADSQAELVGLFVEESDLLEAAALPVTSLVRGDADSAEALDRTKMERGLRAWAGRARASLDAAAARWQVKASFQVLRGSLVETVLAEARRCDLLAIGAVSRPSRPGRVGVTARRLAREAPCAVMVTCTTRRATASAGLVGIRAVTAPAMGPGPFAARDAGRVRVLYEGNPRALEQAGHLARLEGLRLEVIAPASVAGDLEPRLAALAVPSDLLVLEDATPAAIVPRLGETPARVLVLDRKGAVGGKIDGEALLEGPVDSLLLLDGAGPA